MIDQEIIFRTEERLKVFNINIESKEINKPWGGYFVIHESSLQNFLHHFFPELNSTSLGNGKLSPKILIVAPNQKLSWQYHLRREEVWKLIDGKAGLVRSLTDLPSSTTNMVINETVCLQKEERHRLVGLEEWGVVAEIWKHTDPDFPSDEEDIVRLEDNYGRQ